MLQSPGKISRTYLAQFGLVEETPQVNPLEWGPSKILFRSTDNLDELLLVIAFIIKHNLEVLVVHLSP